MPATTAESTDRPRPPGMGLEAALSLMQQFTKHFVTVCFKQPSRAVYRWSHRGLETSSHTRQG